MSLLIYDLSQFSLVTFVLVSAHLLIISFIQDYWIKFGSFLIVLIGIWKVIRDLKANKSKQKEVDKLLDVSEKIGGSIFLLVVIVRWLSGFIFSNTKEISLAGSLFPLLMVILEVFLLEFGLERFFTFNHARKNSESLREENGLSKKEWYGSKSKEYKAESKMYQ